MGFKQLAELSGKRITHVIVKEHDEPGPSAMLRVFLVFDDGEAYEFYSGIGGFHGSAMHTRDGLAGVLRYGSEARVIQWHPKPADFPTSGLSADFLNRSWHIAAKQALFDEQGIRFGRLASFPGALCDMNGYVLFLTEWSYLNDQQIRVVDDTHVPGGISSLLGYQRMRPAE